MGYLRTEAGRARATSGHLQRRRGSHVDVLLVGPFPPPFGGVSVHVRRLARLTATHGFTVSVFNHFRATQTEPVVARGLSRNPLLYLASLQPVRARLVHYHHSRWSTLMATAIALGGRRSRPATVITVHSHSLDSSLQGHYLRGALTRWALRRFDAVVAVSDGVAEGLVLAIPDLPVAVIPAYLSPGDEPPSDLSEPTRRFLAAGGPTLIIAAYRLNTDAQGHSIYGVDFAFELFAALARAHPCLRLTVFLAKQPTLPAERRRLENLLREAAAGGLADRFRVAIGEPLAPALGYESIVLRPTRTDGDAVTVREAIAAGRPVLASDVVRRPDGVETLPLDLHAWSSAIGKLLRDPPVIPAAPVERTHGTGLLEIYRALLPQ